MGVIFAGKPAMTGLPAGQGVVQTGKIWRMWLGKLIRQVGYRYVTSMLNMEVEYL